MSHPIFNKFFVASNDEQIFVFVVIALVSSMNPTVDDRFGSCFGIIEIPLHDERIFGTDFSDLICS